jgi:hypothetical protein
MTRTEDEFFDGLEAHIKVLQKDPTEMNLKSADFIFCLLGMLIGARPALDKRKLGYEE